jgi:hypothetical protein
VRRDVSFHFDGLDHARQHARRRQRHSFDLAGILEAVVIVDQDGTADQRPNNFANVADACAACCACRSAPIALAPAA